jgi:predicted NBD/HSP70 family sugar kinase
VEAIIAAVLALDPSPRAAGVAIPGEMDGAGRCWSMADFPGFDGVHLGDELAARLQCPVFIESDGNTAAVGEWLHGQGRGYPRTLTVLIDERLSAGLVLNGELYRGNSGFAAQIAHLAVHSGDNARPCDCGRHGCLDAHAGLRALSSEYERLTGSRRPPSEVLERALLGDAPASAAVRGLADSLGTGIALVQNVLDLDAVILLCQSPRLFRQIEPVLRAKLRELVFGPSATEVPLFESSLGSDAVVIGAAAMALEATRAALHTA